VIWDKFALLIFHIELGARNIPGKKSNDRPIFPNTAGSSEQSATGIPLLMTMGSGA